MWPRSGLSVPRRLVPDNLRTGVAPGLYDAKLNRSYAELAHHYGPGPPTSRIRSWPSGRASTPSQANSICPRCGGRSRRRAGGARRRRGSLPRTFCRPSRRAQQSGPIAAPTWVIWGERDRYCGAELPSLTAVTSPISNALSACGTPRIGLSMTSQSGSPNCWPSSPRPERHHGFAAAGGYCGQRERRSRGATGALLGMSGTGA